MREKRRERGPPPKCNEAMQEKESMVVAESEDEVSPLFLPKSNFLPSKKWKGRGGGQVRGKMREER